MFNWVLNTPLYSIVRDLYLNNLRLKSEIKYNHISNHQYEVSKAVPSKVSKYGAFSGPYFPVFELNTGKYEPEKTPYLDTFHALLVRLPPQKCPKLTVKES